MKGGLEQTVFVLGAGASLAEAQDRRPVQKKEHPPLDANFFRRVAKYRRSRGYDFRLYDTVRAQARRLGVADLARDDPPVGLEDYLGRLYFNTQHNPLKASVRAYFQMIDLYAWEVLATTQWMIGKAGLIKRVIEKEVRAGRSASIITFNIDMLIENALERLAHSRRPVPWGLRDAYGFSKQLKRAQTADVAPYDYSGPVEIPLYKMHGSVSWVFQTRDYNPPADLASKPRDVWQVVDKQLPVRRLRLGTGGSRGRTAWYAFPLIVPPIYEKHAFIRMHLQEVWDNAETALKNAERVVFWGYSFPVADTHARQFFQGMADQNPVLRSPVVINPDPAAGAALWSLLRAEQVTQYRDAEGYLVA